MKARKERIVSLCKQILNARDIKVKTKYYNQLFDYCEECGISFSNAIEGGMKLAKESIACNMIGIQKI